MGRRGIHSKPNQGASVEWLTPPEIVKALEAFDLDPCADAGQFYSTAKRMIQPPKDGLVEEWTGRVWLNPPYGTKNLIAWLARMAGHGLLSLRLAESFGKLDASQLPQEPCPIAMHESGKAACDAGLRDVRRPKAKAKRMVAKLQKKHPQLKSK